RSLRPKRPRSPSRRPRPRKRSLVSFDRTPWRRRGVRHGAPETRRAARQEPSGPSPFTGTRGGSSEPRKKKRRRRSARARGGDSTVGGRHRPPRSLLAGSYSVQALLVPQHQEPALVREKPVPLHLVDQGGNEGARGADEIGQILLGDAVQAQLVPGGDAFAVRLRERDQHLGEPGGGVLPGEAEHPLPQLAHPLIERA